MNIAPEMQASDQTPDVSLRELIDGGVHFGHPTAKWNPKMKRYIHSSRNGIYIIDLQKTREMFHKALDVAQRVASSGQKVLFVGTKKQAQEIVKTEAERCDQFYVTERWIGGTLTNFNTIRRSIGYMKQLQKMKEEGDYGNRKKKEILWLERQREKLELYYSGIRDMNELPGALFVVDPNLEYIAVNEARVLNIPIIATLDTNCNPQMIDYGIPGNDDSIRSIRLYASKIADAVLQGKKVREQNLEKVGQSAAGSSETKTTQTPVEVTTEASMNSQREDSPSPSDEAGKTSEEETSEEKSE